MDFSASLPESTTTFQIDTVGRITKRRFLGEFTCKIPTLKDQSAIARRLAALNGEFGPMLPKGIQDLHMKLAKLYYTLTDVPTAWKKADYGHDLVDDNIISEVYDKVVEFEDKWVEMMWGKEEPEAKIEEK